jgi:predicted phage-related endonuclease
MEDMMLLFARAKGRPVNLDDAAAELVESLRVIRGRIKTYKEDEKAVAFQIAEFVRKQWGVAPEAEPADDKAVLMLNGHKLASWNSQSRTTLDGKKLLEVHPELIGKFDKTSHFRVMRLAK